MVEHFVTRSTVVTMAGKPVSGSLFHQNNCPADCIGKMTITTSRSGLHVMNVGCVPVIVNGQCDDSILDVS
jgi:hypothetical protein